MRFAFLCICQLILSVSLSILNAVVQLSNFIVPFAHININHVQHPIWRIVISLSGNSMCINEKILPTCTSLSFTNRDKSGQVLSISQTMGLMDVPDNISVNLSIKKRTATCKIGRALASSPTADFAADLSAGFYGVGVSRLATTTGEMSDVVG